VVLGFKRSRAERERKGREGKKKVCLFWKGIKQINSNLNLNFNKQMQCTSMNATNMKPFIYLRETNNDFVFFLHYIPYKENKCWKHF
jgi:hypothetical protein